MNTRLIMTSCAITLVVAGILLTFMPVETLRYMNLETTPAHQLIVKILGALYFSFGMLNWMTRASIIGGIYNRPIAVANFTHFLIAGLGLMRGLVANPNLPYAVWLLAIVYSAFAISFGAILFRHPKDPTPQQE